MQISIHEECINICVQVSSSMQRHLLTWNWLWVQNFEPFDFISWTSTLVGQIALFKKTMSAVESAAEELFKSSESLNKQKLIILYLEI